MILTELSIIMPAYNSEKFIGKAIESILHQTIRDFELIIINDGSTDHTKTIVNLPTNPNLSTIDAQKVVNIIKQWK
jgi:glycosyltransferase involved in cell wall biosynthesis